MTYLRRGVAASLLFLVPALAACGDDAEKTQQEEAAQDETPEEPAEEPTADSAESTPADVPTIALSDLTPTQQALYADVVLFAPDAAADNEGDLVMSSGTFGGDFESSEPVPEGIQVATGYSIMSGDDGIEVTLNTRDGELMTWVDGVVRFAAPADSADDEALLADADALEAALREWVEVNGEAPLVRPQGGSYVLEPGLFDEDAEGEVEVPQSDGITFIGGPSVAHTYSVTLTSEATHQGVVIDQDGRTYQQTYVVGED